MRNVLLHTAPQGRLPVAQPGQDILLIRIKDQQDEGGAIHVELVNGE